MDSIRQPTWLDFVFANRNGSYNGEHYDIVFGPVANDIDTTELALKELKYIGQFDAGRDQNG